MIPLQGLEAEVLKNIKSSNTASLNRILSGHNYSSMGNRCHCGMDGDFPKAVKWSQLQEQSSLLCRPRLRSIYYGCQIKTLSELDQLSSEASHLLHFPWSLTSQHIYFNLDCGQSCQLITLVLSSSCFSLCHFPPLCVLPLNSNHKPKMNKTHSFVDVCLEKILTSFSIFLSIKNVYFVFHLFFYWVIFFFWYVGIICWVQFCYM